MATVSEKKTTMPAAAIRETTFPTRLGGHPAEAVRKFVSQVADTVEELEQRCAQLEDQLLIAEADRRAASELRKQVAEAEAEAKSFADRMVLAETVRDAATARQAELEAELEDLARREPIVMTVPAIEAAITTVDTVDAEQVMRDAAESAARTRSDAHAQARQILSEAQKAAEQVRTEQQRWAGEAERSLRQRLDDMAAEADSRFLDAREAAARILTSAGEEAERIIEHASSEADRMLSEARAFSSKLVSAAEEQASQVWPGDVVSAGGKAAATLEPVTPAPVTLRAVNLDSDDAAEQGDDLSDELDDDYDEVGDALADAAEDEDVLIADEPAETETEDQDEDEPADEEQVSVPALDTELLLAKAEQLIAAVEALSSAGAGESAERLRRMAARSAALRRG